MGICWPSSGSARSFQMPLIGKEFIQFMTLVFQRFRIAVLV